jgi:ATP-binding cassette, subfamily B, bacterial
LIRSAFATFRDATHRRGTIINIPLKQYLELLGAYLRPQSGRAALLTVLLVCSIALRLLSPQILRQFIDSAQFGGALDGLKMLAILFIIVSLSTQLVSVAVTYISEVVGWTATNMLRVDLLLHCLSLDLPFHHTHPPGEMIERIDGDVAVLSNFFTQLIVLVLGNFLLLLGVLVLLFLEDWRVGGLFTVFAVLVLATLNYLRGISVPAWNEAMQARADLFGFLEERLSGTEDIRANGGTSYVLRGFYTTTRVLLNKQRRAARMSGIAHMTPLLFAAIGHALVFLSGATLYSTGAISIGAIYMIFSYLTVLMVPTQQITEQVADLQRATASLVRIKELRAMQSSIKEGAGYSLPPGPLAVELDDVTFGYTAADAVLHNVSFRIKPGSIVGLLGRTGSGKTTITRLLCRLYDPIAGCIRLNDIELTDICRQELRRRVVMVTQEVQLFHATVRDNLTLFDCTIPDERIIQAIDDLGLRQWFNMLTSGLDTELESGGNGLSAGEAQLLAFTRILLKNPGLIILDEASSRLDPATEQRIEHAVRKLAAGRTIIIVAHRLATVERADDIIIFEDGRIVEQGPRQSLINDTSSHFTRLLRSGLEEALE